MKDSTTQDQMRGFLGWVERTGNKLPDPVFLFGILTVGLMAMSWLSAMLEVSALHPAQKTADGAAVVIRSVSLFSPANIQKLWVDMPQTFTHFHPLGYVLVVMLGAGVAERSGFLAAAMRAAVSKAPKSLLTPIVALIAMLSNHAADAGYVVLIPLAGMLYAAAGRHPVAGIAAAFAGVSGGFSANFTPGQLDALLLGITEQAVFASKLDPTWTVNFAGNWWFICAMTFVFMPVIWFVTDKMIEPRLGPWNQSSGDSTGVVATNTALENRGMWLGMGAMLAVVLLWTFMVFGPGQPLLDVSKPDAEWYVRAAPLFKSLVAAFFLIFLAGGWVYGSVTGSIKDHRSLITMMADSMKDLGYYLVLAFVAAHFVAMFAWSNLGLIFAVHGANAIQQTGLPVHLVLIAILLLTAFLNLFIGSASAKWALLAPVLVPMLMLLGISPEATTAVYRVGDGATNIITPLMVYFPLVLVIAQKWQPKFGLGSLTALMLPYSIGILVSGGLLVLAWVVLGIELGPNAPINYLLPEK